MDSPQQKINSIQSDEFPLRKLLYDYFGTYYTNHCKPPQSIVLDFKLRDRIINEVFRVAVPNLRYYDMLVINGATISFRYNVPYPYVIDCCGKVEFL